MPTIALTKMGTENLSSLDGSVIPLVTSFLEKLAENDELPGLRVKPLQAARDRRIRTARVNDDYRAVLIRVDHGEERIYHFVGVWPHDEGNERAARFTMQFNPTLGVAEISEAPANSAAEVSEERLREAYQRGLTDASLRDNPLQNAGWTEAMLIADAGIDARFAEAALAAADETALYAVSDRMPEIQQLMLLDLAYGTPLDEVKDKLGLPSPDRVAELQAEDEETQLVEGARNAPSSFSFLGGTPDKVREAFDNPNMDDWQIFLHPEQEKYVKYAGKGSFRLTGGAGTGKTVVLVHRAKHLHDQDPTRPILLTTYTRTLSDSLHRSLTLLDRNIPQVEMGKPGVAILGIDQVAAKVLGEASTEEKRAAQVAVFGPGRNEFSGRISGNVDDLWIDAVKTAEPEVADQLKQPAFLAQEYLSVVLANEITSAREYARVSRPGRGTRLNRAARAELWKVFEQFRSANLAVDRVTYPEITVLAAAVLEHRAEHQGSYVTAHVLVDEAQDFHAGHWRLLQALAPAQADDLFIAEDSHQRIYGQKLTLKQFGIEIRGRSRRLKLNYRTTAENLRYAMALLEGEDWQALEENPDDPDELTSTRGYVSVRSGPAPKLLHESSLAAEHQAAADQVQAWLDADIEPEEMAVLARTKKQLQELEGSLGSRGIPVQSLGREKKPKPGSVQLRTMHTAKGMEFRCVLLSGVGANHIPAQWALTDLPETERKDALQRERSLLYVAASRARDELAVVWSGKQSPLFD